MREHKSYILANLEEKIKFLNSVNYDYQVIKNPGLSTSKLHEIRRQFHLGSYKEALRKQIEEEIKDSLIFTWRVETILKHIREMIVDGDTSRNHIIGAIDNYIDSLNDHDDGKGIAWSKEESLSQEAETVTTTS